MRIGIVAPPWVPVPPPAYGGTEAMIDNLARGLVDRGHDVHLFTVGESTCPVERSHVFDKPVSPIGIGTAEASHALAAYDELSSMDIIHDHTEVGPLLSRDYDGPPVVTTNHGPLTPARIRNLSHIAGRADVVSISHSQRSLSPFPVSAVIHHGIDTDTYRVGPGGGGYLLFVGRMSPDKGVHRAVQIARKVDRPLMIVSKMREPDERRYYEQCVLPLLGPDDPEPREEPLMKRIELMRHADAVLNPIGWPEPFGLVMAESLACGTPVYAFANGAAPEIIEHGRTGYLGTTTDELADALLNEPEIDRAKCRAAAVRNFAIPRMAREYEVLYAHILARTAVRAKALIA